MAKWSVGGAVMICATLSLSAGEADETETVAAVLGALRDGGYHEIWFERTLLNRVRIVATRNGEHREIVVDPRTGELLRDYQQDRERDVLNGEGSGILRRGEEDRSRDNGDSQREERAKRDVGDGDAKEVKDPR